jgi:hypothetical protein
MDAMDAMDAIDAIDAMHRVAIASERAVFAASRPSRLRVLQFRQLVKRTER